MSERHTLETIAATSQNRHPKKTPNGEKNGWPTLLYQPRQRSWLRPPPERTANRTAVLCPRKPNIANMGGNMDFCPSLALSLSSTCVPRTRFAIAPPGLLFFSVAYLSLTRAVSPPYYVSRSFVLCYRKQTARTSLLLITPVQSHSIYMTHTD